MNMLTYYVLTAIMVLAGLFVIVAIKRTRPAVDEQCASDEVWQTPIRLEHQHAAKHGATRHGHARQRTASQ